MNEGGSSILDTYLLYTKHKKILRNLQILFTHKLTNSIFSNLNFADLSTKFSMINPDDSCSDQQILTVRDHCAYKQIARSIHSYTLIYNDMVFFFSFFCMETLRRKHSVLTIE